MLSLLAAIAVGTACASLRADSQSPESFHAGKWPFISPMRPAVPAVGNVGWVVNPIDAFILHALEDRGLQPNSPADKLTLLRRVTFDLTGLAPTPAEQRAFLADDSQDAYSRVVDRLLESPRYGERWAQHWLDVVRFSETDGFKEDAFRPNAYRYRDYVIRAFNADLPYDRFVKQQLAGDELEPANSEALVATGLNRLYPDETNAADVRQRLQEIHDDLTETFGLAFLGLTIGCARCHDHKFDPISQVDYFRLQAFFAPLLPRDDITTATVDQQRRFQRETEVWEEATNPIRAEIEALLAPKRQAAFEDALLKFEPDIRQVMHMPAERRNALDQQLCDQAMKFISPKLRDVAVKLTGEEKSRFEKLQQQLSQFDHLKPESLPMVMGATDAAAPSPATYRLALGDYRKPLEEVQPGYPAFLGTTEPSIDAPSAAPSTGRRGALARWLCRADHPLTARVMVNRIWQHHFGAGIVATPNDFGAMGEKPTHPELLDWLAVEFIERGWSIKAMHRLILASAAYRQSASVDPDSAVHARSLEIDAGNRLLWHARRQRLDGEAIRDVMLQLSGQLNERMYGASARPELPRGVDARYGWKPDAAAADRDRRSIYVIAKRNLRLPLLEIFDLPDMHNSCPQRAATTTAPQSLALLNGEFSLEQARRWSGRLLARQGANSAGLLATAFEEAFGRPASERQIAEAERFLAEQSARIAAGGEGTPAEALPVPMPPRMANEQAAALVDFCHALLNSNALLFVD